MSNCSDFVPVLTQKENVDEMILNFQEGEWGGSLGRRILCTLVRMSDHFQWPQRLWHIGMRTIKLFNRELQNNKVRDGMAQYRAVNQEIKKGMKKAKENWIGEQCQNTDDCLKNNSKKAYHHHYVPSVVNRSAVMDLHRSRSCATLIQSLYDIFVHSLMYKLVQVLTGTKQERTTTIQD